MLLMASRSPSLLSKSNQFQSALIEKAYTVALPLLKRLTVALSAILLNVLLLLVAYQDKLCEDFAWTKDPVTWEENTRHH